MGAARTARGAAAAVCAAVLLSGCAGPTDDGGADDGGAGAPSASAATSGSTGEGGFPDPVESPLEEYFYAGGPTSQEELEAQQTRYEAVVAACMQQEGFEYEPDPDSVLIPFLAESSPFSVESAAETGYGVTTFEPEDLARAVQEGPNDAYVAAMSAGERDAYHLALYGPPTDLADPDAVLDPSESGCQGRARLEVVGAQPLSTPAFASLQEEVDRVYAALEDSPGVLGLVAAWSDCMADAGYPGYETLDDPAEDVRAREAVLAQGSDEDEPFAHTGTPEHAALEELEIATAVADARCQAEVDYFAEERRLRFAAEQEFVDANRDELEAMLAAAGTDS